MIPAVKIVSPVLLVAAAMVASSAAAGKPHPDCKGSIVAMADAFDRAQLTQDAATLNRMIADDLVFIDGSGVRRDKKAFISGWTGKDDRYTPIVLVDRTFTRAGATTWIVGAEVTLKGVSAGQAFSSRFRFADTFRRTNGCWQAVHIQVTRIAS
jgi:ketosteroid isomerase-like protein